MNLIKNLFRKKTQKQCAISGVVARLSSTYGQIYIHKEINPDRVYLDTESPELKNWCKVQSEKLRKRDF
jgi:hypothetical protein